MQRTSGIILWGWNGCPCVDKARTRLAKYGICFIDDTWDSANDNRMDYFQKCIDHTKDTTKDHSFVYAWGGSRWKYVGTGYKLGKDEMSGAKLKALINAAGVNQQCGRGQGGFSAQQINLYGDKLAECGPDWIRTTYHRNTNSEGRCWGIAGKKSICFQRLPHDFAQLTTESTWSRNENYMNLPRCVDLGMFSLYVAKKNVDSLDLQCDAIASHIFDRKQATFWTKANGREVAGQIVKGMNAIWKSCESSGTYLSRNQFYVTEVKDSEKTALKQNYCKIAQLQQFGNFETTDVFLKAGCFKASGTWYLGEKRQSCNDVCNARGRTCDTKKPATIKTHAKVKVAFAEAGFACKSFGSTDPGRLSNDSPAKILFANVDKAECFPFEISGTDAKSSCTEPEAATRSPLCYCLVKQFSCFGAEGSESISPDEQCNKDNDQPLTLNCNVYDGSNAETISSDDFGRMKLDTQLEDDYILSWNMKFSEMTSSTTDAGKGTILEIFDKDENLCIQFTTDFLRVEYSYCNKLNEEHRWSITHSEGSLYLQCEDKAESIHEWKVLDGCTGLKKIHFGAHVTDKAYCRMKGTFSDVVIEDHGSSSIAFSGSLRQLRQKQRLQKKKAAANRDIGRRRLSAHEASVLNMHRGTWILGTKGQHCGDVCSTVGKQCDGKLAATLTTNGLVAAAFKEAGYECRGFHDPRNGPGAPFATGREDDCAPFTAGGGVSSCTANGYSQRSLCFCVSSRWVIGDLGTHCGEVCAQRDEVCDGIVPAMLTSYELVGSAFALAGYTCKGPHDAQSTPGSPFSTTRDDDCAPFKGSGTSSCTENRYRNHKPLCLCSAKYDIRGFGEDCPSEVQIKTLEGCEAAFALLGLPMGKGWRKTWSGGDSWGVPGGCSTGRSGFLHYNAAFDNPSTRHDLKPICLAPAPSKCVGPAWRTQYEDSAVNAPATCTWELQNRECGSDGWGDFGGSYTHASCIVRARCSNPDRGHGETQTRTMWLKPMLPEGEGTCQSEEQTRRCNNGVYGSWSGSYRYVDCYIQSGPSKSPTPLPTVSWQWKDTDDDCITGERDIGKVLNDDKFTIQLTIGQEGQNWQLWNFENEYTKTFTTTLFTEAQAQQLYNAGLTAERIHCDLDFHVQRDNSQSRTKFSFMTLQDGKIFNINMVGTQTNKQYWQMPDGDCTKIMCYDYEQSHPRGYPGYCPEEFYDGTTPKKLDFLLLKVELDPFQSNQEDKWRNKYTFKGTTYNVESECEMVLSTRTKSCGWSGVDKTNQQSLGGGGHKLQACLSRCIERGELCEYAVFSSSGYCHMFQTCDGESGNDIQLYEKQCSSWKVSYSPVQSGICNGNKVVIENDGSIDSVRKCAELVIADDRCDGSGYFEVKKISGFYKCRCSTDSACLPSTKSESGFSIKHAFKSGGETILTLGGLRLTNMEDLRNCKTVSVVQSSGKKKVYCDRVLKGRDPQVTIPDSTLIVGTNYPKCIKRITIWQDNLPADVIPPGYGVQKGYCVYQKDKWNDNAEERIILLYTEQECWDLCNSDFRIRACTYHNNPKKKKKKKKKK